MQKIRIYTFRCWKYVSIVRFSACKNVSKCTFYRTTFYVKYIRIIMRSRWNAEGNIKVLEQHMLPSRRCLFQQDNAKPHTAAITTAWLSSRRVRVLNWPACSPDLSPIENIWRIIDQKIRQRQPQTLQQLETYIRQERDQIPTPKLQKLITLMPRRLQTVLKRRGDATPWYTKASQIFWDQIWNELMLCIKL